MYTFSTVETVNIISCSFLFIAMREARVEALLGQFDAADANKSGCFERMDPCDGTTTKLTPNRCRMMERL
jgi:hypothetical protein